MGFGALQDLALEIALDLAPLSVSVTTVTPPSGPAVSSIRGIWLDPETEPVPPGELSQTNPKRIIVLSLADVPSVPRGTTIVCPEKDGDADKTWRVEGIPTIKADHYRVSVVLDT